ncbi:MAG TPA: hypothetical protein VFN91_08940 [Myxococcaceae bacterium]|nr:hypothetical protein [Myxococcaceae bacterium]
MIAGRLAGGLAIMLLAGCAGRTTMGVEQREAVLREVRESAPRWLAVSCVRVHLDASPATTFLLGGPLEEQDPRWPGRSEGILPAGTPVQLLDVAFPGVEARAVRPDGTPRDQVWIRLGLPGGSSAILPLPDRAHSEQEFWGALGQWVSRLDPALQTAGWNDAVIEAVRSRHTVIEMPEAAVVAAWGPPSRKEQRFEAGARRETWTWPGGTRRAELLDGQLVESRAPDATGTAP